MEGADSTREGAKSKSRKARGVMAHAYKAPPIHKQIANKIRRFSCVVAMEVVSNSSQFNPSNLGQHNGQVDYNVRLYIYS